MPPTPPAVAGALRLRDWALRVLCGGAGAAVPDVSAEAWRLFLRVEQCALALAPHAGHGAHPEAEELLQRQARADSRIVLTARAQLRALSGLARERGLRVVVVKGGVPLLRGAEGPRLLDLDLFAPPAQAQALAAALDATGHQAIGGAASHRLAVRAAPGELPLEIHTSVPGLPSSEAAWARIRPAPDGRGLYVLHPADHLLYLLLHSAIQHADRRGRLRDLLVVAEALSACAADEVREVEEALARDPQAGVLAAQLGMARAMVERRPCADAFEMTAAGTYLLDERLAGSRLRGSMREMAWQAGTAAIARRSGAPVLLGEHGLALPSAVPALAALRRVAPGVERAARLLVRRSREWAFLPLARSVAAAAERAVREHAASR